MATEMYTVSTADAVEMVATLLERDDVRLVRVEDIDGEPLAEIPGTSSPEGGAKELMERWQEYDGGGTEIRLVAETGVPPDAPPHGAILEEPPEHPQEGEPRSHG